MTDEQNETALNELIKKVAELQTNIDELKEENQIIRETSRNLYRKYAKQLMNVEEVAAMLRLKPQTIYQKVMRHEIPFYKIKGSKGGTGKNLLFDWFEIIDWLTK